MKQLSLFLASLFVMGSSLFAEGAEAAPAARDQGSFWQTLIMIGIALVFFYFILWRPEQKRRKAMEQQRSALKKGDRVTAMGIIGSVVRVQETTVNLKMCDGAKIEVLKAAITDVQPGSDEDAKRVELATESSDR
jgi:preprotein translocase subunit YajC